MEGLIAVAVILIIAGMVQHARRAKKYHYSRSKKKNEPEEKASIPITGKEDENNPYYHPKYSQGENITPGTIINIAAAIIFVLGVLGSLSIITLNLINGIQMLFGTVITSLLLFGIATIIKLLHQIKMRLPDPKKISE